MILVTYIQVITSVFPGDTVLTCNTLPHVVLSIHAETASTVPSVASKIVINNFDVRMNKYEVLQVVGEGVCVCVFVCV